MRRQRGQHKPSDLWQGLGVHMRLVSRHISDLFCMTGRFDTDLRPRPNQTDHVPDCPVASTPQATLLNDLLPGHTAHLEGRRCTDRACKLKDAIIFLLSNGQTNHASLNNLRGWPGRCVWTTAGLDQTQISIMVPAGITWFYQRSLLGGATVARW